VATTEKGCYLQLSTVSQLCKGHVIGHIWNKTLIRLAKTAGK